MTNPLWKIFPDTDDPHTRKKVVYTLVIFNFIVLVFLIFVVSWASSLRRDLAQQVSLREQSCSTSNAARADTNRFRHLFEAFVSGDAILKKSQARRRGRLGLLEASTGTVKGIQIGTLQVTLSQEDLLVAQHWQDIAHRVTYLRSLDCVTGLPTYEEAKEPPAGANP